MTSDFAAGNYRYIPAVFQYSAGAAASPGYEVERVRFDKRPKHFGDDKKPFEGKKYAGKRDRDEDWKQHRPREKRDVPLDPDSPWAALAALRNPKPE